MVPKVSITLKDVSKKFGTKTLFTSINCQLHSGECLLITGANGSGKTTLIKMIARLLRPTSGIIEIIADNKHLAEVEQSLPFFGLVSPDIVLYEQLTAMENIVFLAAARGILLSPEQISQALNEVGLELSGDQKVKTYSTGMKQRLKFALILSIDPPVWLVDEGLSNLDNTGRESILMLLKQALERQRLLILATNEQAEIMYATQTIALY